MAVKFLTRLHRAIKVWEDYSRPMRTCVKLMLEHYANKWYQGGRGRSNIPINLVERGVKILAPFLVARNPKVMVTPKRGIQAKNLRPFARTLELALEHLFEEIQLAENTLRPVAIDSLFSMGITKTGIMHSHNVEIGGYLHDVGQPYCDRIDFNDYIGDVAARNRQEMKIEGHRYRLPLKYVQESGLFRHFENLKPDIPAYGDDTRPENISKNDKDSEIYREIWPTVELIDLWIPDENIIVTIPPEGQGSNIMRTVEWDGPEGGPFDVLAYAYFPGSCIPIPPVYTWLDLNKAVNVIVNKMRTDCEREKVIGVCEKEDAEDAEVIRRARHGDLVGLNNPDAVKELHFGGFNAQSYPFLQFLLTQYSRSGPNLEVTGGRTLMGATLGQEQLLQANAFREIDDMVSQMYKFTRSVAKKLAWYLWTDPFIILPLIKRVGGVDVEVEYSESAKEGDFLDYSFDIEPYSLTRMSPETRFQRLMQLISEVVIPLAGVAASQGSVINVNELVRECARYLNIPNIDSWWSAVSATPEVVQPYAMTPGTPRKAKRGVSPIPSEASNLNNLLQQQTRSYQKSSAEEL